MSSTAEAVAHRKTQVQYDAKWRLFLKRAHLFRHIPFIDGVLGSGSIALGNVTEESDLDALICAREGRIFTARFFAALFFGAFGWRRSKEHTKKSAKDKVCLNHFSTPQSFTLTIEPNEYWEALYQNLVPLYGTKQYIQDFFDANNEWMQEPVTYYNDLRHIQGGPSRLKRGLEYLLQGSFGDMIEKRLKAYQIGRIERGLPDIKKDQKPHYIAISGEKRALYNLPPRIVYTDTELDFHPDPITIEVIPG